MFLFRQKQIVCRKLSKRTLGFQNRPLQNPLNPPPHTHTHLHTWKVYALTDLGKADNIMDALFGLEMEEEFTCEESGESKMSKSTAKKLVCNIQGGAGASTQARGEELEGGGVVMLGGGKARWRGIGDGEAGKRDTQAVVGGVERDMKQPFDVCICPLHGRSSGCLCRQKESTTLMTT